VPLNRQVQRRVHSVVLVGWSLLAGLVGPVPIVMTGILAEDRPEVAFVVDQHPVGALGSCAAYPSLGVAVGPHRQLRPVQMTGTGVCG
jgi:hypothetical protein